MYEYQNNTVFSYARPDNVLQRRDIKPGRDISILGFDDSLGATRANPPLSSVSASPAALGHQALLSARNREENDFIKLFIYGLFSFERGSDQSYTNLLSSLNWLKIDNAFLYTFEKPILHLNKVQFTPPRQLFLKAVRLKGEVSMVPLLKQTVPIEELYCNNFMDPKENYRLVLLPLFSGEMLHGLLLCDLADSVYKDGEFLTSQMGTATKMIYLLLSNKEIQQQLEDNLVTLRENNIVLDALSKSDGLTGILNRRGFEDSAEQLLELNRNAGKNTLAIYVDMNNLKIINDRYGHEEGDYSLRHIAKTLSDLLDSNGIVGRIGGDEYACLLTYQGTDNGEKILSDIYDAFDSFNKTSSKSYNITVAAGCCLLGPGSDMSLAEALAETDEQLYKVKQLRKKEVEKN